MLIPFPSDRSGEPLPVSSSAHCMVTGEGSRVYSTGATMSSVALPIIPSGLLLVNNSFKPLKLHVEG